MFFTISAIMISLDLLRRTLIYCHYTICTAYTTVQTEQAMDKGVHVAGPMGSG